MTPEALAGEEPVRLDGSDMSRQVRDRAVKFSAGGYLLTLKPAARKP